MPVAVTVPDVAIPPIDTRPVAAVVEEAPEHELAAALRRAAAEADKLLTKHRLEVRTKLQQVFATIAAAELEGWSLDVGPIAERISKTHSTDAAAVEQLTSTVRKIVHRAHALRVRGANTLHTFEKKITEACRGWLNDLDDYAHELKEIDGRTKKNAANAPLVRAGFAYQQAIREVLDIDVEPQTRLDLLAGEPFMWFSVPLPNEIRRDRRRRKDVESRIHDKVSERDSALVGLVAIQYTVPMLAS